MPDVMLVLHARRRLVLNLIADQQKPAVFFCGGSRNHEKFIDLLDGVFILEADLGTVLTRLRRRPADEWGGTEADREHAVRLHASREDLPANGISVDATQPVTRVVDDILALAGESEGCPGLGSPA